MTTHLTIVVYICNVPLFKKGSSVRYYKMEYVLSMNS